MNVRTEHGKIIITVGEGFHEIYIDEKFTAPWLKDGQTGEYTAGPGPHKVGVRKDGTWLYDETVIVPKESVDAPEPEHPQEPVEEHADIIRAVISEMRDIANTLERLMASQENA